MPLFSEIRRAVFKNPVTDLFFWKQSFIYNDGSSLQELYHQSPLSARKDRACRRGLQALYNEVVEVVTDGDEVCVRVPNLFFDKMDRIASCPVDCCKKHDTTLWCLRSDLVFFDECQRRAIPLHAIPEPISFKNPASLCNPSVIVLTMPWQDPETKIAYSVGTRFVRVPEHDGPSTHAVLLVDYATGLVSERSISKSLCCKLCSVPLAQRRKNFVALIRRWADKVSCGIVPYVWGGSSMTHCLSDDNFYLCCTPKVRQKEPVVWCRDGVTQPFTGFDCSLLILRAAQICGIPYFCKNSYTVACDRPIVQRFEDLQEGDIIWYEGHVMVVSDLKANTMIEACGYSAGYGCLHECPLEQRFVGVKTYQDLWNLLQTKKPLGSLSKKGTVMKWHDTFKFFKLY